MRLPLVAPYLCAGKADPALKYPCPRLWGGHPQTPAVSCVIRGLCLPGSLGPGQIRAVGS